jgi:protein-S-isoprenylcysteine O-methyltransferase Ste14
VSDTTPRPRGGPVVPRWLVPVQGTALFAHALPGGPRLPVPEGWSDPLRVAGAVAVVAGGATMLAATVGLGRDFTIHPTPRDDAVLRTDGLYARSRHPLYAGTLLASAGAVLVRQRVPTLVASGALAAVLHVKAGVEDRVLEERFGDPWRRYADRTPRLLPRLVPALRARRTTPAARRRR